MQELHQRLRDVIAGHCASWPGVTTLQKARGLAATPYPLCNMLLGIHLRASLPAALQPDSRQPNSCYATLTLTCPERDS